MFISALDRPWLETPFKLQGIWIRSLEDIELVKLYCDAVYVDPDKSWIKLPVSDEQPKRKKHDHYIEKAGTKSLQECIGDEEIPISLQEELGKARKIYNDASSLIVNLMDNVKHDSAIDLPQVKHTVSELIASIERNPDALTWLSLMREKNKYLYQHSLNVAIHMLNLGRHLKLPKPQLLQAGLCGLLEDIGKMMIPEETLKKSGTLTDEEQKIVKEHVRHSIRILSQNQGIDRKVLQGVSEHHERFNGSGYPKGLRENQISILGSMAAICDTYDAIMSERPGGYPSSSFRAIKVLYDDKGKGFNPAMVERFIQCIGVYPPGSVVELNTGELGIVIEQNKFRRLKPKVLVVCNPDREQLEIPYVIDLLTEPLTPAGTIYMIKNVVEPGDHHISASDYYL